MFQKIIVLLSPVQRAERQWRKAFQLQCTNTYLTRLVRFRSERDLRNRFFEGTFLHETETELKPAWPVDVCYYLQS